MLGAEMGTECVCGEGMDGGGVLSSPHHDALEMRGG